MATAKHATDVQVTNLSYSIDHTIVLEGLSFEIPHGDYVGILGANGSGKTTLLKMILGLLHPTSGSVHLFGKDAAALSDRERIGYVPQRASRSDWDFPATVEEVVASGRTARVGMLRRFGVADRKAIDEALEATGLSDLRGRLIGHLSGGQRQRVFIARALAGEPDMLILDEPTASVDAASEHAFYAFLKKLNERDEITIILVSHDIETVTQEARTILCLNRELVCHLPASKFISEHHLESMYGDEAKHLLHRHTHEHSKKRR